MKKTLITLLALAGISCAAETTSKTYVYTGDSNAWLDVAANWKDTATNTALSGGDGNGNLTAAQTAKNTFTVDGGTVKGGKMCHFTDATLDIKSNAKVSITGAQTPWTNAKVKVASGSSLTYDAQGIRLTGTNIEIASGGSLKINKKVLFDGATLTAHGSDVSITSTVEDIKLKNFTLNLLSGKLAFGKTWFDGGSNSDGINFTLGEGASVSFSESSLSTGWNTTITLSTSFSKGYVQNGTGDVILGEQVLIDFGSIGDNASTLNSYLTSGLFAGESIKADGSTLELGSFDATALSAEDVGKYQFVIDGSKLKVQYAAYSQSIPEPTTAALSLLALAGLAARRRRR